MAAKSAPTGQDAVDPTAVEPLPVQPVAPVPEKGVGAAPAPDMLWREHEGRIQKLEKREEPAPPALPAAPPPPTGPLERPGGTRLFPDFVYELLDS